MSWIELDGSMGEGGGQILRTGLSLSMVTGRPFKIENIRARRSRPGLLRQHLTAVKAAIAVSEAEVEGAEMGSTRLVFRPGPVRPGEYMFSVGTAGSATLVLQTVLPAFLIGETSSRIVVEGGTHNPFAPPFDFLDRVFLPLLRRMGPEVHAFLERPGFYPAGGGRFQVVVQPATEMKRLDLLERGRVLRKEVRALVANLPRAIGEREVSRVRRKLSDSRLKDRVEVMEKAPGPGNILFFEVECEGITELFSGFGQRSVSAEKVADSVVRAARRYLANDFPVGEYLADQILLPLAIAGGGSFRTTALSKHTTTHLEVIRRFLEIDIETQEEGGVWTVKLRRS